MKPRDLVEDGRFWLGHGSYATDEAALRLHHRLVWIHPFPNGEARRAYIEALRAADRGDLDPLSTLVLEGRAKE